MMSQREFLKQQLLKELETKHAEVLKQKLGKDHPLYTCQEISVANQTLITDISDNKYVTHSISTFMQKHKRKLKEQKNIIKEIEKINFDDIIDTAAEIKAATEDIKDNLLSQISPDL